MNFLACLNMFVIYRSKGFLVPYRFEGPKGGKGRGVAGATHGPLNPVSSVTGGKGKRAGHA